MTRCDECADWSAKYDSVKNACTECTQLVEHNHSKETNPCITCEDVYENCVECSHYYSCKYKPKS